MRIDQNGMVSYFPINLYLSECAKKKLKSLMQSLCVCARVCVGVIKMLYALILCAQCARETINGF